MDDESQTPFGVKPPVSKSGAPVPKTSTKKSPKRSAKAKVQSDVARKDLKLKRDKEALRKREARLRKIQQIKDGKAPVLSEDELQDLPQSTQDFVDTQEVAWSPNSDIQKAFLAATEKEVLYAGGRGPLAYGEKVLTPKGFVNIEDVRVGDIVVCPDNSLDRVVAIPFDDVDDCYEFELSDGRTITTGKDHEWKVRTPANPRGNAARKWRIDSTANIVEELAQDGKNVYIPLSAPLDYATTSHDFYNSVISPYTLGLLLGDGCLREGRGRNGSIISVDSFIRDHIISEYPGVRLDKDGQTIYFKAQHKTKQCLMVLGVWDKLSQGKFVPKEYLTAPLKVRLELLQGLMDTDGCTGGYPQAEFTTVSPRLAKDVQLLVQSLGGKATIGTKIGTYRDVNDTVVECQLVYRLYISIQGINIFKLPRKAEAFTPKTGVKYKEPMLRIVKATYKGKLPCKCITISRAPNLFITSGHLVTKNSGKSDCLMVDPLRYVQHPAFRAVIIRRTMPDLRDLIDRARLLYAALCPEVKWRDQEKLFIFPSGAKIEFGYCDSKVDLGHYHGKQYTWIGIDELTLYEDESWLELLLGSLRSKIPGVPALFRATTNPSGPGVQWVKKRFVEPEMGKKIPAGHRAEIKVVLPHTGETRITTRKWFQSSLLDNKHLMESDPEYIVYLSGMSEAKRNQWLYGSWDGVEGAAFPEFSEEIHVIEPFAIPRHWTRFRSCDWGFGSKAACIWFALNPKPLEGDPEIIIYRELITSNSSHRAEDFANAILDLEMGENIEYGVLDSSTWADRGQMGASIADQMINIGCDWMPSDRGKRSRTHHKMLIHDVLAKDRDTGKPRMVIVNTCVDTIHVLKTIQIDEKNNEDVNTKGDDHSYDAVRYGLASRPINSQEIKHLIQSVQPPVVINRTTGM